jgi:hypothetical protein
VHFKVESTDHWGRYNNDQQRDEVKELFRRGRQAYAELED